MLQDMGFDLELTLETEDLGSQDISTPTGELGWQILNRTRAGAFDLVIIQHIPNASAYKLAFVAQEMLPRTIVCSLVLEDGDARFYYKAGVGHHCYIMDVPEEVSKLTKAE
jgi:hypothetical protein